jgi:prepilin-type N-terminal cleavage/methylation domain-containing protein
MEIFMLDFKHFRQKRYMKNKAFTLAEMLVALLIVGAIAALSIPSLVDTLQRNLMASQIKSITVSIQQLLNQQLVDNHVKSICDTDFATPDTLLSSKNFVQSVNCSPASSCVTQDYKRLSDNTVYNNGVPYRSGSGEGNNIPFIRLKNGAILGYAYYGCDGLGVYPETSDGDKVVGAFYVDVNGDDKPNINGRDYFTFHVTRYGRTISSYEAAGNSYNDAAVLPKCQAGSASACYAYLQAHNWKMSY